jgi:hypothetical protein
MRGRFAILVRYMYGLCAAAGLASCVSGTGLDRNAVATLRRESWMAAGATSDDLLYVSNGAFDVYVYSYPVGEPVGMLQGFYAANGLCSDGAGDVFVTENTLNGEIIEYAHGGRQPIATLSDPNIPSFFGCAVSPITGSLAATTYSAWENPRGSGSVAVFSHNAGTSSPPQVYYAPRLFFYFFCTYDDSGNLFVAGQTAHLEPAIDELAKNKRSFTALTLRGLPQGFHLPGGVVWDGKYLALGDPDHSRIYRLKISANTATLAGSVKLAEGDQVEEFTIGPDKSRPGRQLIGPNSLSGSVMLWPYPAGGLPTGAITNIRYWPTGTALSVGSGAK